jgi:hypothetical protein
MRQTIAQDQPKVVVLGYWYEHDVRNTGAIHKLPWFNGAFCRVVQKDGSSFLEEFAPKSGFNFRASNYLGCLNLLQYFLNYTVCIKGASKTIQNETARHLFLAIDQLCKSQGAKLLVANIRPPTKHARFLSEAHISWCEVRFDFWAKSTDGSFLFNLMPGDGHHNPAGQYEIAKSLFGPVKALLTGQNYFARGFEGNSAPFPRNIYPLW